MLLPLISFAQVQPIGEEGDEMRIPDLYDVSPPVGDSVAVMFRALNDYYNWGIRTIGLDTIKELYTGKNIKVCICDTGRPRHYAYQNRIIASENFTPDDTVDDLNQHSTHVAGIIHEIAPEAGLLFAKVLDAKGVGTNAYVANGIEWCALNGADAINLSLGGGHSAALKAAIDHAANMGILVIAAAGNNGQGPEERMNYPALYDTVIAVGSIDQFLDVSWFSSSGSKGDIMAPGERILSTYGEDQYQSLSGTSMAAPFISGVLALYLEKGQEAKLAQQALKDTAKDMLEKGWDRMSFYGYVTPKIYSKEEGEVIQPPNNEIVWISLIALGVLIVIGVLVYFLKRKKGFNLKEEASRNPKKPNENSTNLQNIYE